LNKAKRFALEEESADALTHEGQPVALTEAESNAGATAFSDEEEDAAETGLNFGGGEEKTEDETARRAARSTKEVMEEVIAKSKMFKLEKQEAAKQQEERLQSLDGDLSDIRGLLEFSKPKKKATDDPEALLAQIREGKDEEEEEEEDEFVSETKKLALETRARATDRLKTPEETAKEEHATLQRMEAARIRRMNGEVVEEEEEKELAPTGGYAARRARAKAELVQVKEKNQTQKIPKHLRTDEDLDGNFELDPTLNAVSEEDEDEDEEVGEDEEEEEGSEEEEQAPSKKVVKFEQKAQEGKSKKEPTSVRNEGKVVPAAGIIKATEAKATAQKSKPSDNKSQPKVQYQMLWMSKPILGQ